MLSTEFMQLAFGVGLMVGLLAPAVGFFLVERRMSLVGDAIGHMAFAGVAAGFLLGVDPVLTALGSAVVGAVGIEWLRARGRTASDQALALLLYVGIAAGVVMINAARAMNASLFGFLFGSILTVTPRDLMLIAGLGALVLLVIALLYRPLLAIALDEEGARAAGLPVQRLSTGLALLAAVTIAVSMRAVGLLLIAALMVLPVMSAGLVAWSVRSTLLVAMGIGAGSVLVGLSLAYALNLAPAGTIVLVCAACFGLLLGVQRLGVGGERSPRH